MIIIGIDPGTAKMGYGVIRAGKSNKKVELMESNVLITHPNLESQDRLMFLYKSLNSVIKEYKPDVMVIEKLFFNTNAKTAIAVGQARGVSMLAAAKKHLKVYEYTALEAKLELTGYGRSDKKVMQEAVKKLFGLSDKVKSDDANDAVAMALCFVKKTMFDPNINSQKKNEKNT